MSTVPDVLNGWEDDFIVPTQFSETTMAAISTGNLTSSARAEIVQMSAAKMFIANIHLAFSMKRWQVKLWPKCLKEKETLLGVVM